MKRKPLRKCDWILLAIVTIDPLLTGCNSGDGIARATVAGNVTLDGQPLPDGNIRFIPKNNPAWSAIITNGKYTTEGTKGVPVGNDIRVEIQAFRLPRGYKGPAPDDLMREEGTIPLEQYLPSKFNIHSQLQISIESGMKRVEKNFDLKSK